MVPMSYIGAYPFASSTTWVSPDYIKATQKTFEALWDCKGCGAQKLLGKTHRCCPQCGLPQNASDRYKPAEEERIYVKGEPRPPNRNHTHSDDLEGGEFVHSDWQALKRRPDASRRPRVPRSRQGLHAVRGSEQQQVHVLLLLRNKSRPGLGCADCAGKVPVRDGVCACTRVCVCRGGGGVSAQGTDQTAS